MAVWSTFFEQVCGFTNGVGGCTTIVESRHGGPVANTPPTASTPTHDTPSSAIPTHASSTSSQAPKSASPSPTRPFLSSTSPSASPTKVALPDSDPPSSESSTSNSFNASSTPSVAANTGTATDAAITMTSTLSSATVAPEPDTSGTNTSAANSLRPTPPTPSASPGTSFPPLPSPSASSQSHLPATAIAGIAIGVGTILILFAGCIWYVTRRRRLPLIVVSSGTSGASDASIWSRTRPTVWHTLLSIENEGGKLEYSSRGSSEALQGSTRSDRSGSMVAEPSNFEPLDRSSNPLSGSLETVPFFAAPPPSGKGVREAASTGTANTALSPATMEATTVTRQSTAEMEGGIPTRCDPRNGDAREDGGINVEWSGRTLRYETDAGIRLSFGDGPPCDLRYTHDDQCTIASVATAPPPYSRY